MKENVSGCFFSEHSVDKKLFYTQIHTHTSNVLHFILTKIKRIQGVRAIRYIKGFHILLKGGKWPNSMQSWHWS